MDRKLAFKLERVKPYLITLKDVQEGFDVPRIYAQMICTLGVLPSMIKIGGFWLGYSWDLVDAKFENIAKPNSIAMQVLRHVQNNDAFVGDGDYKLPSGQWITPFALPLEQRPVIVTISMIAEAAGIKVSEVHKMYRDGWFPSATMIPNLKRYLVDLRDLSGHPELSEAFAKFGRAKQE